MPTRRAGTKRCFHFVRGTRPKRGTGRMALALGLSAFVTASPDAALADDRPSDVRAGTASSGKHWKSTPSGGDDLVVTSRSDSSGYQMFIGRSSERFAWRPLATLQPAGNVGDTWVGYHCVTGNGRYAVAVVGQRHFMNHPVLRDRGGLAYVIDTATGKARILVANVALKYHSPGCGVGSEAALVRHLGQDQRRTEVLSFDLESRRLHSRTVLRSQLTSPVPTASGTAGVMGRRVVILANGDARTVAKLPGRPYMLRASRNGLDTLTASGRGSEAWSLERGRRVKLAAGRLGGLKLFTGAGGINTLVRSTGSQVLESRLRAARMSGKGQIRGASLRGTALMQYEPRARGAAARSSGPSRTVTDAGPTLVDARTGRLYETSLPNASAPAFRKLPHIIGTKVARAAVNTTTPKCAVPRNDLRRQVPQPNIAQINWAIQQATRNLLQGSVLTRPSNYANMGLAPYAPSADFARGALSGDPAASVPPSVIQAVFAQESAWLQASRRALPGVSGNPGVSDYYGSAGTISTIDYDKADCGYGVSQVTDPMTATATRYSANGKAKVAVDYAANVASGITFLVNKWNELYAAGIKANNADPKMLENWYFAIWAYNSGVHPKAVDGPWGLGWTNNPMNSDYPPDRIGFLRSSYADAERPGDWPYQERVFGWMETPQLNYKGEPSYATPVDAAGKRAYLKLPATSAFCRPDPNDNDCRTDYRDPTGGSADYCTRSDRKCWWHNAAAFATCPDACARSTFTVAATATEPAQTNSFEPACASTLPEGAIIVDEQPSNLNVEGCTAPNWTSQGTFSVSYGKDAAGVALGQIDWHQLGTGFGGHTWFTKNQRATDTSHINVGTWTPPVLSGSYNVKAHIPPSGASTSFARYRILQANGTFVERVIDQHLHENRWVSLGNFALGDGARVELTNSTPEADETANVAFDAMAFTKVAGTVVNRRIDATTTFDSNQSLDTDIDDHVYWGEVTDFRPFNNMANIYAWGMDWTNVGTLAACDAAKTTGCVGAATRGLLTNVRSRVQTAGNTRVTPEPADTQPKWLNFASPTPPSPITDAWLSDPDNYKVRARLRVDFLENAGVIDPSSVTVTSEASSGNTKLPTYALGLMRAVRDDYGVALPDLRYSAVDLTQYTHATTAVDVAATGVAPGRAYRPYTAPAQLSPDGRCVLTKLISGGTIGTRPMTKSDALRNSVEAWVGRVKALTAAGRAPALVGNAAEQVYNAVFRHASVFTPKNMTSPFSVAPPIWMQLNVNVCADGSVRPGGSQLAFSSYMPDLYLYVNGAQVGLTGASTSGPAQRGDFLSFSHPSPNEMPGAGQMWDRDSWMPCNLDPAAAGYVGLRDGQPWDIRQLDGDDQSPALVRLCDSPPYTTAPLEHE